MKGSFDLGIRYEIHAKEKAPSANIDYFQRHVLPEKQDFIGLACKEKTKSK